MMRAFALAIVISFLGTSSGAAAQAQQSHQSQPQPPCASRASVVAKLKSEYNETAHGRGMTTGGGIIEVFSSPQGSWTILVTMPGIGGSLVACLVGHGESWDPRPNEAKARGENS